MQLKIKTVICIPFRLPEWLTNNVLRLHNKLLSFTKFVLFFLLDNQTKFNYKLGVETAMTSNTIQRPQYQVIMFIETGSWISQIG